MKVVKIISLLEKKVNYWHEMTNNNEHLEVRLEIEDFLIDKIMWKKCKCDLIYPSYIHLENLYKKCKDNDNYENRKEFYDCFENEFMSYLAPEIKQVILKGLR